MARTAVVRRWWRRPAILVVVLALGVIAAAALLTQTAAFRSWLRTHAVAAANRVLDGELTVGRLEGNLLGTLVVHDLRLRRAGERLLAIGRLEARYDLLSLVAPGPFRVRMLAVDGLALTLVERDGRWNVAGLVPASGGDGTGTILPVEVARATVRGGAVKVRGAAGVWRARDLALAGRGAVSDGVRLEVDALSFAVHGRDVTVERLAGRAEVAADGGLDVAAALRTGESRLAGHLRIGGGAPPRYDAALAVRRLAARELRALAGAGAPAVDLAGSLRARGPASAVVVRGRLTSPAGRATLAGTLDLAAERYDLALTAAALDPSGLTGRPQAAAALHGRLTVVGSGFSWERADARLALALDPSTIGALEVTGGAADLRLRGGRLAVERLLLASSAGTAEASGELALGAAGGGGGGGMGSLAALSGRLAYGLRVHDLGPLASLAGVGPLAGAFDVRGTAAGSAGALDLEMRAVGRDLRAAGGAIGALDVTVTGENLGTTTGRAAWRARATDVRAGARPLAAVVLDGTWDRPRAGVAAEAALAVDVQETAARRHALRATAAIDAGVARVTVETLRLHVGGDTWHVEGRPVVVVRATRLETDSLVLAAARGRVELAGRAGTTGPLDLALTVEGVELDDLAAALPIGVRGRLGARLRLGGTAAAPTLAADVTLARPAVGGVRYQEARAQAAVADGAGRLAVTLAQNAGRRLVLEASTPVRFTLAPMTLAPGAPLEGRLRAEAIDLAFLAPLVPALTRLGGRLDADLALAGSADAPVARGRLALTAGRATVEALGVTYDPIEVAIRLDNERATIERLWIESGTGTLRGEGGATLGAAGAAFDLRVELRALPLLENADGRGAASGWVWMTGTSAAPYVEGALTVDRLAILLPEEATTAVGPLDPTIQVVGPGAPEPAAGAGREAPAAGSAPALYDRLAMTVQLAVPGNAWLRRSDAEIDLAGWMTLWKKPGDALRVAGEIDAQRGWYAFRGKRFSVAEGRVTFTGHDLDPLLALTAVHKTRGHEIFVLVGGRLSAPTLALESDPPLEQSDVLSVLLFGKTTAELSGGESTALREQTVAIASSYAARGLSRSVASTLGLDTLGFDSGSGGLEGASVTAGKYVSEDVFVSLSHRFGTESVDELRVEYDLTGEWSIETSADTLGRSGVDVFWRRRY